MTTYDVIFVGESSGEDENKSPKEREPKHSTCSESKQAKNASAPGTKKSYAEAMKNGAKSTTPRMNKESVQKTLQSVLTTVQQLMRSIQQNGKHGGSSDVRTETHGKRPKEDKANRKGQTSDRQLSDDDYILLGKGLSFCPKTKSHDKIKLAEERFKYSRRMRLKEYFFESETSKSISENEDNFSFFNKRESSFLPPSGRDVYLDFYTEAISQEILHNKHKSKRHSNISKSEFASFRRLLVTILLFLKRPINLGLLLL